MPVLTRRTKAIAVCAAAVAALGAPIARGAGPAAPPAEPTMGALISGTVSVLHGTHVWTDYAYDDRGPDASTASSDNAADLIQLKLDNPDLDFAVPEEGAVRWSDNMMIPAKAEHPYGAEVWMNYVYEPQIAARITAYVGSISPVDGIQELVAKTAPDLAENPLVFPDADTQARLSGYPNLGPAEERQMNERYAQVTGG